MNLILGSPLFMAPELVRKCHDYTEKVDIWALGCITYLLLTNTNPFHATTVQKIHNLTLNKPVVFNSDKWDKVSK